MFTTQKQVVIVSHPSRQKSISTYEKGKPKDGACLLHLAAVKTTSGFDPRVDAAGVATKRSGQVADATTCADQFDHLLT
jgi:hypothetical protein